VSVNRGVGAADELLCESLRNPHARAGDGRHRPYCLVVRRLGL